MEQASILPTLNDDGKANRECMAYASLYTDEIEDYFELYPYRTESFRKFFNDDDVFDHLEKTEKLKLEVARKATKDSEAFRLLQEIVYKDQISLWKDIHLSDIKRSSKSFKIFSDRFFRESPPFLVLDRVSSVIDVPALIDNMCCMNKYPSLRKVSQISVDKTQWTLRKIARRFLRELPRLKDEESNWWWDLVEACTQDAHNIEFTLKYLMEDWRKELADHRENVSSSLSMNSLDKVLLSGLSCRPPSHFAYFRSEEVYPNTSEMPELREYQKELVVRTDRGENTVVCAPTGSGKTVVGAHIALHHLKKRTAEKKPGRVVMIVPKVFLVEQQKNLFKRYSKREYYISLLSGDTNETGEAQLITFLSGDIVVLTPQILVNMLSDPSEKCRLYVSDITLLLLDECHHTDKKNPYNVIMQYVQDAQYERPQVVGLTASLGVGEGPLCTETQAFNHVVRMCLRMASKSISTIVKNKEELNRYVQIPEDKLVRVYSSPLCSRQFQSLLIQSLEDVQRSLYVEFDALIAEKTPNIDPLKLARFPPVERMEEFTQAVVNCDTELRKLIDGDRKWRLKRGIQFIKMYHNATLLNDLLPASYAYEQLLTEVEEMEKTKGRHCIFLSAFQSLRRKFEDTIPFEDDKEILQLLRKELISQFSTNNDSRVLIFCLRRETAQLLVKYLNAEAIQGMGRAEVLTSTNAASIRNGQSTSEQRTVIESFMKGSCRVLVSTSVAEEGLDVAACNLIIKYNNTGNVISLVQQRGRARAHNSRSVLLALDERIYIKESKNKMAEQIMSKVVEKIYHMKDSEFDVALRAEELIQEKQERANEKEMEKRKMNFYKELSILCEKCSAPICSSTTLRFFHGHYISIDSSLWKRMHFQAKKGPKIDDSLIVAGKVKCPCEKEIGGIVKIEGQFVPVLKAESLLFRTSNGQMLDKCRKWSKIKSHLLDIKDGNVHEASAMNNSLSISNTLLRCALERCVV